MAAMRSVHSRHFDTTARVKPLPPGQVTESSAAKVPEENGMKVKSKDEAQVGTNLGETDSVSVDAISDDGKELDVGCSFAEIVVQNAEMPGKNCVRHLNGRRFSYTIPEGARQGDILRVKIPEVSTASQKETIDTPSNHRIKSDIAPGTEAKTNGWVYKDADETVFGPFDGSLMASWFQGGMIPGNLLVKRFDQEVTEFQQIDVLFAGRPPFE